MNFCIKCGNQLQGGNFCTKCGAKIEERIEEKSEETVVIRAEETKRSTSDINVSSRKIGFLPSFILGLIGSIFGIMGGLCMTMCTSLYSSGSAAFIFIFGGSIVGLIGACKCIKDVKTGSIIELIGSLMIGICAYGITGGDMQTVLAFFLILFSGIIGFVYSLYKHK